MVLNLLQLIVLFAVFLLLLLGIVFLFYPVGRKISNYLLAAFIFSNFVLLSHFFAFLTVPNFIQTFPNLNHIGSYSYFLLAPLLFLYLVSLVNNQFKFSLKSILHILPYLIFTSAALFSDLTKAFNFGNFSSFQAFLDNSYHYLLDIQVATYVVYSFKMLRNYRIELNEKFSNTININLMWVNTVLYFLLLMWLTDALNRYLSNFQLIDWPTKYYLLIQSVSTELILCICLIYKGMRQAKIPAGISPEPKRSKVKIDDTVFEESKILLSQIMETEKPYLMPELNLDELAKMANVPTRQISQTINNCFDLNFNSYINKYRVSEAKRIIENDAHDRKTLYEVLLDSGFNSKSVFNEAFKKHAGITPKDYRKKIKT